jgi:metal-responsive CopG/Arc/MetJ family transcriptional regulator
MGKTAGVRKMGRPIEIEDAMNPGVLLPRKVVERLDALAAEIGISRGQLIRNLTIAGLEEAEVLRDMGLFAAMRWTDAVKERLHGRMSKVDSQVDSQVASPA